ncbi:MAG: hypothetical protein R2991_14385 [Thermoanaerobaculia bacterium]
MASSVAMVMPLVGFEVTPTRPTMREETVTKKKAAIATRTAETSRGRKPGSSEKICGTATIKRIRIAARPDLPETELALGALLVCIRLTEAPERSDGRRRGKLSTIVGMLRTA